MAFVVVAHAQVISVSAPSKVSTGENFRISYTINTQNVDDFKANIPSGAGLEVIAGPYTSYQSSYQMINGHTSNSSTVTLTYTLFAEKAGRYNIPSAYAKVGGKTLRSKPIAISVTGAARHNGSGAPNMHNDDVAEMRSESGNITSEDLFVKVSANKKRVYEQEPILLTYKVYTLVNLTSLDGKMPDLNGFHTQEIQLPQQKSFHIEKLNGRNYRCVTWSQYVMYPQMTGKLSIPSITFKGTVVRQNRNVDPFEEFFNGGSGYTEIKRNIVAPGVDIQVDKLPSKPTGFSGGVGHFTISAQLDKSEVNEGDPLNLRVVIGGTGNLKLIKQPIVDFPKDFDKYDPKVTDKTQLTANGISGNMIYDILAVPRNKGEYTIPSISFTYYDTSSNAYKTVKTQPLKVEVRKGDGKKTSVDDYSAEKDSDIRPLKSVMSNPAITTESFFGSMSYWLSLSFTTLLFVILMIVRTKWVEANADVVGMKGRRANKIATKRLKKARKLMESNKNNEFYDEVLRTLWGYVGDKLNMQVEQLSRDNVSDKLQMRGIDTDIIDKFQVALDECEYERYAPGDASGNMMKTYDSAMVAITEIEKSMKQAKVKSSTTMTMLLFVFMAAMQLFPMGANAAVAKTDQDKAYEAYSNGDFVGAERLYVGMLKNEKSAELYYNLGNCHYRLGNMAKAVVCYEKALRLSPSDADIRYNLEFVRSKTIDRIAPQTKMFFESWYGNVLNAHDSDGWAYMAVAFFLIAIVLLSVYIICNGLLVRRIGFYGAMLLLALFLASNVFAWKQKEKFEAHDRAVLVVPSADIKKTPSDGAGNAYVIHEGTGMTITDKMMKGWLGVKLDDGREGWLRRNSVEII